MSDTYESLRSKVEEYFDVALHLFEAGRHELTSCRQCFLPKHHPVHLEESDGGPGRTE